jgi:hypothetical protein
MLDCLVTRSSNGFALSRPEIVVNADGDRSTPCLVAKRGEGREEEWLVGVRTRSSHGGPLVPQPAHCPDFCRKQPRRRLRGGTPPSGPGPARQSSEGSRGSPRCVGKLEKWGAWSRRSRVDCCRMKGMS